MPKLGTIIAGLASARRALGGASATFPNDRLDELAGFGSNPGNLGACTFIPPNLRPHAPLVVVLHGCTQNAALYDRGSGWSELAAREGFGLLYPEQQRANNPNLCFNWYQQGDARRGQGEAESIGQMVKHLTKLHGFDRSRVYVTGLSAGGAMTSVMLAAYPDLFAGGAVIAGLPFASANSLPEALRRMRDEGAPSRRILADRAGAAARHSGPFPTLSVWHGTQDRIVDPGNADALVDQWRDLHGVGDSAGVVDRIGGHRRETWRDRDGRAVVERYDISGMGHGTPLAMAEHEPLGNVGPHMLEAGISSTRQIARSWGLTARGEATIVVPRASDPPRRVRPAERQATMRPASATDSPGAVIERALRAAGLMR